MQFWRLSRFIVLRTITTDSILSRKTKNLIFLLLSTITTWRLYDRPDPEDRVGHKNMERANNKIKGANFFYQLTFPLVTGNQKRPKMKQNSIKSFFFAYPKNQTEYCLLFGQSYTAIKRPFEQNKDIETVGWICKVVWMSLRVKYRYIAANSHWYGRELRVYWIKSEDYSYLRCKLRQSL